MYKKLILLAFIFTACIDFDIDAPYDDINGIYLELIESYSFSGYKLIVEEQRGYLLNTNDIVCANFENVDSIYEISSYQSVYLKPDFAIANGYAYILGQNFGLEIVDFRQTNPQLSGFLRIYGPLHSIELSDHNAYVAVSSALFTSPSLYTVDVSDVNNPVSITEYTFERPIRHFEVESDYLYILFSDGTFQIIAISNPTSPELVSEHNLSDTLNTADYFTTHSNYLYVTKGYDIDTYEILGDGDLAYQNTLSFSQPVRLPNIYENFGLCLSFGNDLYLLNLEYPSRPCIGEVLELPASIVHGVINDQYIYLVDWQLQIVEIKDIEQ